MDRSLAMLLLLGLLVLLTLLFLALFAVAPIFWSCMASLLYTLSVFLFNERHHVHNAQEFENRFWTIFAVLFSTALFFAKDSPLALGVWSPSLGFLAVLISGYAMHVWDRSMHRLEMSKLVRLKRGTATSSLNRLQDAGIPIENILAQLNACLNDLDQTYIPSTINNWFYKAFVIRKEREVISIFEEAEPSVLNYLVCNSKLGLIFYKVKDHQSFKHQHRTKLIELLAIEKLSQLNVHSRVIVLHSLQTMKLPANAKAEYCVRNIILNTKQDDLSDLKTLMDSKGDYWCMNKLIYDDITSDIVRHDILDHIQRQAKVQFNHIAYNTRRAKTRKRKFWRKVLSDVDDTLTCSGGSYPSGIDRRYGKKVMYPGVLGFYRELDLGTDGPDEWPEHTAGNLVFLSARPHVYKDMSEKINHAKFAQLQKMRGMHTTPSLLSGDIRSGVETLAKNDFGPLARKKFENFQQYVSIYPEFKHVFVCDNGQGDVQAAQMMVDTYPKQVEAIYVHQVQPISKTYKYNKEAWVTKPVKPYFFKTYTEAALHAATRNPPLIRVNGLKRICENAISDFYMIQNKQWPSQKHKWDRHGELNQSLCYCNEYLAKCGEKPVPLIESERLWKDGQKVQTPFGRGEIMSFDPIFNMYEVELDWRPLDLQAREFKENASKDLAKSAPEKPKKLQGTDDSAKTLETVFENEEDARENNSTNFCFDSDDMDGKNDQNPSSQSLDTSADVAVPHLVNDSDSDISFHESHNVTARIHCRYISKFSPPNLPVFAKEEDSKSSFSFWGSRSESEEPRALFKKDDKCGTQFGCGTVIDYRKNSGIVVVKMSGWSATCYLNAECVNVVSEGFFNRMLRMISTDTTKTSSTKKTPAQKDSESPFTTDSILCTPYGQGHIIHLPDERNNSFNSSKVSGNRASTKKVILNSTTPHETVAVSLSSWILANKTSPVLYCTVENARRWKALGDEERAKNSGGLLSTFSSIVSQSVKKLIVGKPKRTVDDFPSEISVPTYARFFSDGAVVNSPYGIGSVTSFREADGVYTVELESWKMADGKNAKLFTTRDNLNHHVAKGCIEGFPVLTSLGLTGTLISVQPRTGIHMIAVPTAGMVCYMQPRDVLRPLKASVNDNVLTLYGNGKVVKFRPKDDTYEIELCWGAKLFATADSLERATLNEKEKAFLGMSWVLKFFFSSENDIKGESQKRSRSNSMASARTTSSSRGLL